MARICSSTGAQPIRYDKCYVLPKSRIDVDAALVAAKLHCWPGHPTQPKAFELNRRCQGMPPTVATRRLV